MYWKWFRDLTKTWITLSKSEYERYKNMYDELIQKEGWCIEKIEDHSITWKRIKGYSYSVVPEGMGTKQFHHV